MRKIPKQLTIAWCRRNQDWVREQNEIYDKKYPSHWSRPGEPNYWKTKLAAHKARAKKLKRDVAWSDEAKIEQIFRDCPADMTIHHEFPLQAGLCSGLHHEANLQYLTLSENASKHNSFSPRRFVINRGSITLF
jgi:hypothetical protein